MRNKLFGSRVRGPFTDRVLRARFLTSEQKVTRRLDHYRARGDKTIATRTLRAETRSQRPVFLEIHSLAAGRLIIIGVVVNANGFYGL